MSKTKDYNRLIDILIQDIRDWFEKNGKNAKAVIGISGGKDSTVAAALLTEALGRDRVVGVLMPNGVQPDIDDAKRVVSFLGITSYIINIKDVYDAAVNALESTYLLPTPDALINLPPRIRMATLYAVAQSLPTGGRVINTCNLSEDVVGYSTKYGDSAGDVAVLAGLFVSDIVALGDLLGLPKDLVHKAPSDGLCGVTDEERFGFTYDDIERYVVSGTSGDLNVDTAIEKMHNSSRHKFGMYVIGNDYLSRKGPLVW